MFTLVFGVVVGGVVVYFLLNPDKWNSVVDHVKAWIASIRGS